MISIYHLVYTYPCAKGFVCECPSELPIFSKSEEALPIEVVGACIGLPTGVTFPIPDGGGAILIPPGGGGKTLPLLGLDFDLFVTSLPSFFWNELIYKLTRKHCRKKKGTKSRNAKDPFKIKPTNIILIQ